LNGATSSTLKQTATGQVIRPRLESAGSTADDSHLSIGKQADTNSPSLENNDDGISRMVPPTAFTAKDIDPQSENIGGKLAESHADYFSDPSNITHFNEGGVIYGLTCPHTLQPFEKEFVKRVGNLSCFPDETVENYVPHIGNDMDNLLNEFTPVLVRAAYILPGVSLQQVCDPIELASSCYQKANQPTGTTIWEESWLAEDTFRMTRAIIPYVYYITIQFKVSKLNDPEVLSELSTLVGTRVDGGLLLERTKRSVPPKEDRTRKAKSVLLYTKVEGGVLVNHLTVILQSSLPSMIEAVIDSFGSMGLAEACQTTRKTRKYWDERR
jgi:hypothetical protein